MSYWNLYYYLNFLIPLWRIWGSWPKQSDQPPNSTWHSHSILYCTFICFTAHKVITFFHVRIVNNWLLDDHKHIRKSSTRILSECWNKNRFCRRALWHWKKSGSFTEPLARDLFWINMKLFVKHSTIKMLNILIIPIICRTAVSSNRQTTQTCGCNTSAYLISSSLLYA